MSTKCSLAWGEKFHVYTDCVDNHAFVYVEIAGAAFEASPGEVTVQIPLSIWEHIRTYSPAKYDLADLIDVKLRQLARKRLAEQKKMLCETEPRSAFRSLFTIYGTPSMRKIFRELQAQRKAQQKLRAEVEQLRKQNNAKSKLRRRLKRRKRVLLPEFKRLIARRPKENQIKQALYEVRGDS